MKPTKPGRGRRIAERIAQEVAELITREVRDPRIGLVTVTGCEITPDYAHADVYYTAMGCDAAGCQAGLEAAAGMLRSLIYPRLRIHTVPTLHFVPDTSVERGFAMDRVISEALRVTEENERQAASNGKEG